jgi:hypothetical protein
VYPACHKHPARGYLNLRTHQGTTEVRGLSTFKFTIKGLQANNYYATADLLQLPVELDQVMHLRAVTMRRVSKCDSTE